MAPHSSTLAWKIPWVEEPGGPQSMGSLRVGHDWATSLPLFTFIGEGNGNPLQCSCLENPRDGGASWAAVYGVAQSWTRLKWLSSSSSSWCEATATTDSRCETNPTLSFSSHDCWSRDKNKLYNLAWQGSRNNDNGNSDSHNQPLSSVPNVPGRLRSAVQPWSC